MNILSRVPKMKDLIGKYAVVVTDSKPIHFTRLADNLILLSDREVDRGNVTVKEPEREEK